MAARALLLLLLASLSCSSGLAVSWHRAKRRAHDTVVELCRELLVDGPRRCSAVHVEPIVDELPAAYGLRSARRPRLTPDLVAFDEGEALIVEVTIVPDAAVNSYASRKRAKYAPLGKTAIVALGTGGAVPGSTLEAIDTLLGGSGRGDSAAAEDGSGSGPMAPLAASFLERALAAARSRPDAPRAAHGAADGRGKRARRRGARRDTALALESR